MTTPLHETPHTLTLCAQTHQNHHTIRRVSIKEKNITKIGTCVLYLCEWVCYVFHSRVFVLPRSYREFYSNPAQRIAPTPVKQFLPSSIIHHRQKAIKRAYNKQWHRKKQPYLTTRWAISIKASMWREDLDPRMRVALRLSFAAMIADRA